MSTVKDQLTCLAFHPVRHHLAKQVKPSTLMCLFCCLTCRKWARRWVAQKERSSMRTSLRWKRQDQHPHDDLVQNEKLFSRLSLRDAVSWHLLHISYQPFLLSDDIQTVHRGCFTVLHPSHWYLNQQLQWIWSKTFVNMPDFFFDLGSNGQSRENF